MATKERAGRPKLKKDEKSERPQRNKGGRPPTYQPAFAIAVREMSAHGWTDFSIARAFNVEEVTIWRWRKTHAEFAEACTPTEAEKIAAVEGALLSRAMGYEHDAVKILMTPQGVVEVPYVERYPPDVAAAKAYLYNRDRDRWSERQEVEQSGGVTIRVTGGLPDEEESEK